MNGNLERRSLINKVTVTGSSSEIDRDMKAGEEIMLSATIGSRSFNEGRNRRLAACLEAQAMGRMTQDPKPTDTP